MNGYEVVYTGGGIWLSLYHMEVGDNTLTYRVDNEFPNILSCFVNIGKDYEMYEENMIMSIDVSADPSSIRKEIHKILLENLHKEMC